MKALLALVTLAMISSPALAADEPAKDAPVKIEQAEKLIDDGIQVLDVRTKEEWDQGHLKGAKMATVTEKDFLQKARAALDPKKPVLVYCKSGGRSERAVKQLREAGYSTVYDMDGGITEWEKSGKPVEK